MHYISLSHPPLHSTVVLLKAVESRQEMHQMSPLHSTVVLLKVGISLTYLYDILAFTFYCSSIKSLFSCK